MPGILLKFNKYLILIHFTIDLCIKLIRSIEKYCEKLDSYEFQERICQIFNFIARVEVQLDDKFKDKVNFIEVMKTCFINIQSIYPLYQFFMINKYSLRFSDINMEYRFQEYLDNSLRKYILLVIILQGLIWNIMDFAQTVIESSFEYMTVSIIFSQYVYSFFIIGIFAVAYFFKPKYMKWALFLSNHVYAYVYWSQNEIYSDQQSNLCTFILVGAQMITFVSAEYIETVYQLILFTGLYTSRTLLETEYLTISLIVGAITAGCCFIMFFYYIQKNQRQKYQLEFINNQWEKVFNSLIKEQYLIFDYDDKTCSFSFRGQREYNLNINETESLREYLRLVKLKETSLNLEQYLYTKLKDIENIADKIISESLEIEIERRQFNQISISIFQGIKPIIIIQNCTQKHSNNYSESIVTINQQYFNKYNIFMQLAKKYLFTKLQNKRINYLKFKRIFMHENLKQGLVLFNISELPTTNIFILKLLSNIRKLYPEKKIEILNPECIYILINNTRLITIIIIDILENILSQEVQIKLNRPCCDILIIRFCGFLNLKSFNYIETLKERYIYLIQHIEIKQFGKNIINLEIIITIINRQNILESQNNQENHQQLNSSKFPSSNEEKISDCRQSQEFLSQRSQN